MRVARVGRVSGQAVGPTNHETPGDLVSSREASGFSRSGMLLTPRAPSTAAEGAAWLGVIGGRHQLPAELLDPAVRLTCGKDVQALADEPPICEGADV